MEQSKQSANVNTAIWILLVLLAILGLRIVIQFLQENIYTSIWFIDLGAVLFFGLPLLEAVSIVAIFLPLRAKVLKIWFIMVLSLMTNALWRIWDWLDTIDICHNPVDIPEGYCDVLALQVFVHVPFLVLATIMIIHHWKKNSFGY